MLEAGTTLLRGKYALTSRHSTWHQSREVWLARDADQEPYLIRIWGYGHDAAADFQRALWDRELGTLYRIASSPGAEDLTVTLRDAGVDQSSQCFVMVLGASIEASYPVLGSILSERQKHDWLDTSDAGARLELWGGLERVARAIGLLHDQDLLHRNIGANSLFVDPHEGPESFRLGGFEWSVRLGQPSHHAPPTDWHTPPEFSANGWFGYRRSTDWFGFGMLVARVMLGVEHHFGLAPEPRLARVLRDVERAPHLTELEKALIGRLIAIEPIDRLTLPSEIIPTIEAVKYGLTRAEAKSDDALLILAIDPKNEGLIDYLAERGFSWAANPEAERFYHDDPRHLLCLRGYLDTELADSALYAMPRKKTLLLKGRRVVLLVRPFDWGDGDAADERGWAAAYVVRDSTLRGSQGGDAVRALPAGAVRTRFVRELRTRRENRQRSVPWDPYLPVLGRAGAMRLELAKFRDFLRFTNQLELLMRATEIFAYKLTSNSSDELFEHIEIQDVQRATGMLYLGRTQNTTLTAFLAGRARDAETQTTDELRVILTGQEGGDDMHAKVEAEDAWEVRSIDEARRRVGLRRRKRIESNPVPHSGFARPADFLQQLQVIGRRKRAIDSLPSYAYLLRALTDPKRVLIDSGPAPLPVALSLAAVDANKQAAMRDILRVRPLYALQGPPGTGKTTLVAHLLRQIFDEDPVAQVLITAQQHSAVDVLRRTVEEEAFKDVPLDRQPLSVRLGDPRKITGGATDIAKLLLTRCSEDLSRADGSTAIATRWRTHVDMLAAPQVDWHIGSSDADTVQSELRRFVQLVRRGANITYCTTSAGDLEQLVKEKQFDWSILEESGKCHGFDMVLPLEAGHRWLLIGDHSQLPPYRFADYSEGIAQFDRAIESLDAMKDIGRYLVDHDWLRDWKARGKSERDEFRVYCARWLTTFATIFGECSTSAGLTGDDSSGALAGRLSKQYRMHPAIGSIVSDVYYDSEIENATVTSAGLPDERVVHALDEPSEVRGKAVVWIDTPWAKVNRAAAQSPDGRNINHYEADVVLAFLRALQQSEPRRDTTVAVLTPYRNQMSYLRRAIVEARIESELSTKGFSSALRGRLVHTVDSFQGNEADIVVVSLVKNHDAIRDIGGIGFLDESSRMNVLLSRAQQLLVLVGSKAFFEYQTSHVDADDRTHGLSHWPRLLTVFEKMRREQVAVVVNSTDLLK